MLVHSRLLTVTSEYDARLLVCESICSQVYFSGIRKTACCDRATLQYAVEVWTVENSLKPKTMKTLFTIAVSYVFSARYLVCSYLI
jgi:hypothetical protein